MSKKMLALLVAAAALVCFSGSALALTAAHQAANTNIAFQGDCSACHIPHKAAGAQRLFPLEPGAANIARWGYMGAMCAQYCHGGVAAVPFANALPTALKSPGLALGAHGMTVARIPSQTAWGAGTLPYLTAGTTVKDSLGNNAAFECTTCHNAHKDATAGENALLQQDMDTLCDTCHNTRGAGDAAWNGGGFGNHGAPAPNTGPIGVPVNTPNGIGSHPVGTDITTDVNTHDWDGDAAAEPDSDIYIGLGNAPGATVFDKIYGAAAAHNLGGHLIAGGVKDGNDHGPVGCVTCHSIHGNQNDADPPVAPADGSPFEDLLVINQGAHAVANGDPSAGDGNNMPSNGLCNACHIQGGVAINSWNPGNSAFSHPCDAQNAQQDMGAIVSPVATWPLGNRVSVPLMSIAVICETCHDPHGATVNTHILRNTELDICGQCHTMALGLFCHHPVGAGLMGGRMVDAAIGDQDNDLECSDCHNGSGAHNWTVLGGIGLDPDWEPFDNCRNNEQADGVFKSCANQSKECFDCHTNNRAHPSPTAANGEPAPDMLEVRGEGTHIVGNSALDLSLGRLRGAPFNAFIGDYNPGVGVLQARFGGVATGNYDLVCESCHELQPRRYLGYNVGVILNCTTHLNHEEYTETYNQAESEECGSCHGLTPGAGGTHPLTGQTVTKAVDAPRAPTSLITAGATYADAAGAPNSAEYPAANRLNCDSCHQPHDAPTNSGTFILEYYNNVAGSGLVAKAIYGGPGLTNDADAGQGIPHNSLCLQCHNY